MKCGDILDIWSFAEKNWKGKGSPRSVANNENKQIKTILSVYMNRCTPSISFLGTHASTLIKNGCHNKGESAEIDFKPSVNQSLRNVLITSAIGYIFDLPCDFHC